MRKKKWNFDKINKRWSDTEIYKKKEDVKERKKEFATYLEIINYQFLIESSPHIYEIKCHCQIWWE